MITKNIVIVLQLEDDVEWTRSYSIEQLENELRKKAERQVRHNLAPAPSVTSYVVDGDVALVSRTEIQRQ